MEPPQSKRPKVTQTRNLHSYFSVTSSKNSEVIAQETESPSTSTATTQQQEIVNEKEQDQEPTTSSALSDNDIGCYLRCTGQPLSDLKKLELLRNPWRPSAGYNWPHSIRNSRGKEANYHLTSSHLENYEWLEYSHIKNGLFCKYCVLYETRDGFVTSGLLITAPFSKYHAMFGKKGYITVHQKTEYHSHNVITGKRALETAVIPEKKVIYQLNAAKKKQAEIARAGLQSIISTVVCLGRAGAAFRGHRDDGDLYSTTGNDGLFREVLRLLLNRGDSALDEHLKLANKNASYISKTTQDELIDCCGETISETICQRLKESYLFTVIADETTDKSKKEQMTLCVRYVHNNGIREEFLKFVDIIDLTGQGIADTILSELKSHHIDISGLVGMGFDGASAMKGQYKGVQAILRKTAPKALYVHCAAHCLNLTISKASEVKPISNTWSKLHEIINFFHWSALRLDCLSKHVRELDLDSKRERLSTLSDTRWVERHNAVLCFKELFPAVIAALEEISNWRNRGNAQTLIDSMNSEFFISLVTLDSILVLTQPLSRQLQAVNVDLISAMDLVQTVKDTVKVLRNDSCEQSFHKIFQESERLSQTANGCEITVPRTAGRQKNRENVPHTSPEDYYKKIVYIPFLDSLQSQFNDRFDDHFKLAGSLVALVPAKMERYSFNDLQSGAAHFMDLLPATTEAEVQQDYCNWVAHWKRIEETERPTNICSTLSSQLWDSESFTIIDKLLRIFATLPVSTATGERSFSTLDFLKNYRRTTMNEERLNGLALLYIHRNASIEKNEFVQKVMDRFISRGSRRTDFCYGL